MAIEVDTLFRVAGKDGVGVFNVTNSEGKRLFLNVAMFEIKIENGEIIEIPYTRDNINSWKISVQPAKTIIDPKFTKALKVSMKCKDTCDKNADQVFRIGIVPTPYYDGDKPPQHLVQMAIGFGAIFVNPGKDQPLNYNVDYKGNDFIITNNNPTYMRAIINACDAGVEGPELESCRIKVNVLGGRKLTFLLPEKMRKQKINLKVESDRAIYKDDIEIKRG